MPVPAVTTSAAGSLTLLEDPDKDVRVYALNYLLSIVGQFWAEMSDKLPYLELLADPLSKELAPENRPFAALLISKIYFYMGFQDEAVEFALKAGVAFGKESEGEYRETIIAGCLDQAIDKTQRGEDIPADLQSIVDSVLRSSTGENAKLAMGLALSLRRLDLIEMIYLSSRGPSQASSSKSERVVHDESLLRYVLAEVVSGTSGNEAWPEDFRANLFSLLRRLFHLNPNPDWNSITTVWAQSSDVESTVESLVKLLNVEDNLTAYQIAFDLTEVASQAFIDEVREKLGETKWAAPVDGSEDDVRVVLNNILRGDTSAELFLNFLSKNNKTDMSILKVTKETLEDRYSIYHSAITFTNAFAHCGTTSDTFLRENLDWLGRASNWAKFSTTAALGLIHRGSWVNGNRVVKPYLPGGAAPNKYSEGGALFALGLIYAGRVEFAEEELKKGLAEGNDPIVQHGAALGMGVSALASADDEIYDQIRPILFQDDAVAGEAAGYAMGLVMLGTASERALEEMLSYARETQHEKIIRGLAMGIAFLMYGQREAANPVIQRLTEDKDAILRYGGMFTIALAFAGTGNNKAVKKLLHVAVSDVNDDVRRAAVTALGFVLFRNHTTVPRVVQLLAESYNPHVRYGATLALGISCAGTGLESAIELLEPMTKDPVDYVRQGAYISLAMILIQQSEAACPKSITIRELFAKVVADKHEDPMARFGASLAQGIIDAGGRNLTLALSTRAGTLNQNAVVGMALFVQFWYWFPLAHGLGLAFTPTAVIAIDGKMKVPQLELECHARPSLYAYPATEKKVEEKKKDKQKAAVLSTTARAKARERVKKAEAGEAMDTDDKAEESGKAKDAAPTPKKSKPSEPSSFKIPNMSRVTPSQLAYVTFPTSGRYTPVRPLDHSPLSGSNVNGKPSTLASGASASGSIVVLRDEKPEEPAEYIELSKELWPGWLPANPEAAAAILAQVTAEGSGGAPGSGVAEQAQQQQQEPEEEAEAPPAFEYPFEDE
ncbi:26S proteasome regulatory subunit N2 [Cryptococcus neoformans C23]|uniref:26S proteasome regulatory subunit RPN2 n=1 Tax=Cryptococcus neoformans (strain H99 / ATCC 208821 / CBS 10515 / FGSC 9487) TaxID=235443 RepID=J9VVD8_CRYN9|nr:26S proteasome regulatory subunit N2 [Cryptococcus neoformans var. grubii H99]AUB28543.1 26S proteasome regulatory subunit N2 [Cryptococcus neoformans var. grubii]OWT36047.1 26S proteasome regulatory subunit N2 [Cryptococcus neoformans var. grubii Bt1]OWZ27211.1 26S proteasome regulatory subunit N2 [Cryptococcus neoformans var. grubii AD2-60a]OWZ39173.1 26S proteasome regulatory subunit N2 [Cryptococcus neoformans var. grubii C23]OXC81463.1 26S proteasome regulatory subunit N2 [Cryptococcus|eukprot:XP_012053033.1 26S proteasome regulatory subunit N2 [Cryptococcus neoformans var. grubii H99]